MSFENLSDMELLEKAQKLRVRYPGKIPVIFIPDKNIKLEKYKFLCDRESTFSHLLTLIRKYIDCKPYEAIFCMINNTLPPNSMSLQNLYSQHCMQTGMMFIHVKKESTFG
jgi:hypothetical protein